MRGFMVKEHFDLLKNAGLVLNEFNFIAVDDAGKVLYYGVEAAGPRPDVWTARRLGACHEHRHPHVERRVPQV